MMFSLALPLVTVAIGKLAGAIPAPEGLQARASDAPIASSAFSVDMSATAMPSSSFLPPAPTFASMAPAPGPSGGVGLNVTPIYEPMSDFDYQTMLLGLHQEFIELDLFHYGLMQFSQQDFAEAGITPEDMFLIEYMADQEVGHATMFIDMIEAAGAVATKPCNYSYPIGSVYEFLDFCQKITRLGESGTYGFLPHLNSQPSASLIAQAVTIEARQQLIFRQFEGLFPMPEWFVPSLTQSMQWTLLAPFITSCPAGSPHLEWQPFPALHIQNNPNASLVCGTSNSSAAAISTNCTALSAPGMMLNLTWDSPGQNVGPNNSYTTNTTAGSPAYVAWISQLNTTYTPLTNISGNAGLTQQPGGEIFGTGTAPLVNGTMFVLVTDSDPYVTPYNLSQLNPHVVAGPAIYQAG
ncbi:Rds1 protein [Obba rivulosa]|uniref:Rds1 protein n=1 Tax=Obba rivulosa TaxID=1052685 RepID=A0A8E2ALR7_9APHY|nr:Rds1 protein [Obba rivulosa]